MSNTTKNLLVIVNSLGDFGYDPIADTIPNREWGTKQIMHMCPGAKLLRFSAVEVIAESGLISACPTCTCSPEKK